MQKMMREVREVLDKRILRYKLSRFRYSDNAKAGLSSDIVLKIFFSSFIRRLSESSPIYVS